MLCAYYGGCKLTARRFYYTGTTGEPIPVVKRRLRFSLRGVNDDPHHYEILPKSRLTSTHLSSARCTQQMWKYGRQMSWSRLEAFWICKWQAVTPLVVVCFVIQMRKEGQRRNYTAGTLSTLDLAGRISPAPSCATKIIASCVRILLQRGFSL